MDEFLDYKKHNEYLERYCILHYIFEVFTSETYE